MSVQGEWILLAVTGVVALFYLYYYTRYLSGVQRRVRHQTHHRFRWKNNESEAITAAETPIKGVSVIVCARNEEDNLQHYLQALCSQKYPLFEVIVVNDGSEDNTQTVLEHYTQLFRNLRLTFVPRNAWVSSSKKLALTLAAKAARYDYLLLTDADCRPESPNWITEMMRGFDNTETEVVIGYGGYFSEHSFINRLVRYDTVQNALTFLGFAMSRHPYMGVGRNLAYRKDMFFRNNGFAGLLNHRAGDDDLFVNKIANRHNTEVVLTSDSFTWSVPNRTFHDWRVQKYRHLSVSPDYRFGAKMRLVAEPVLRAAIYTLLIISLVAFFRGDLPFYPVYAVMAVVAVFVGRLIWLYALMNRGAHIFRTPHFLVSDLLVFDIFLPVYNLMLLIKHAFRRKKEIKW